MCVQKGCELTSLLTVNGLFIVIPLKGGPVIKFTKNQKAFVGKTSSAEWYGIMKKKVREKKHPRERKDE